MIPWLAESKTVVVCISTAATTIGAPCLELIQRRWEHDPDRRVVRCLSMDSFGFLRTEPVITEENITEIYKADLQRRLIDDPSSVGAAESLLNGTVCYPWHASTSGAVDNPQMFVAQKSAYDIQYLQLDEYYMRARLPPQQDPDSVYLVKNCMSHEDHEREMRSRGEAKEEEDAMLTTPAFDRYTVNLLEQRADMRFHHAQKILSRYSRIKPHQQAPFESVDFGKASLLDWFFGKDTLDHDKKPIIYVYMDPAAGGSKSDCVIISFISRAAVTFDQIMAVQGNNRTWKTATGVCSYLKPVDTLILGVDILPKNAANSQEAARYALEHMFGLIRTHISIVEGGFKFVFVIENNMWSSALETCNYMKTFAENEKRAAYESLRREVQESDSRKNLSSFLSPDFIRDHVLFWHGIPDKGPSHGFVAANMFSISQGSTVENGLVAPPPFYYRLLEDGHVLPKDGALYGNEVGLIGTKTTSMKKNIGFSRLGAIITSGRIDFHPHVVSIYASDITTYSSDGVVKTCINQFRQCPKVPTRPRNESSSGGAGIDPSRTAMEAEPQKLRLFKFGKGANPNFKDDLVTSFAHAMFVQWSLMCIRLLQTDASTAMPQEDVRF